MILILLGIGHFSYRKGIGCAGLSCEHSIFLQLGQGLELAFLVVNTRHHKFTLLYAVSADDHASEQQSGAAYRKWGLGGKTDFSNCRGSVM